MPKRTSHRTNVSSNNEDLSSLWQRCHKIPSCVIQGTRIKDTEYIFISTPELKERAAKSKPRITPFEMAQRSTRLMGKARITELRRSPDKRILAQVYLFKPWKQISRSVLMTRQKLVEALPSRVFSQLISEFEYDENTLVHTAVAKCVGEQELFADPDDSFVIDLLQDILDEGYVHPFSDDDDQLWISANGWYTRSEIARNDGRIEFTDLANIVFYNPDKDKQVYCFDCERWLTIRRYPNHMVVPSKQRTIQRSEVRAMVEGPVIRGMGWKSDFPALNGFQLDWLYTGTKSFHVKMLTDWTEEQREQNEWPRKAMWVAGKLENDERIQQTALRACFLTIKNIKEVWQCPECKTEI